MQPEPGAGAVIAQGNLDHLEELKRALSRGGVAAQLVRPPKEQCGT
ncbi:MAG: hypothetical protein ABI054_14515 [Planctomycetota bacterium]